MSQQTSLSTGEKSGLKRVCEAWDFPRSTFYSARVRAQSQSEKTTVTRNRSLS